RPFSHSVCSPPALHSFPTRRSSDLLVVHSTAQHVYMVRRDLARMFDLPLARVRVSAPYVGGGNGTKSYTKIEGACAMAAYFTGRSEEHTSELQSRENLVCRLLLEKK